MPSVPVDAMTLGRRRAALPTTAQRPRPKRMIRKEKKF